MRAVLPPPRASGRPRLAGRAHGRREALQQQRAVAQVEDEFDEDFANLPAEKLALPDVKWPAAVAGQLSTLALSATEGLCHPKRRKRTPVPRVVEVLTSCLATSGPAKERGGDKQ